MGLNKANEKIKAEYHKTEKEKLFKIIDYIYFFIIDKKYKHISDEDLVFLFGAGIGIIIIYFRLFRVKKILRWYEYTIIGINIVTIFFDLKYGVFITVFTHIFLLFNLYMLYYPRLRRKSELSKTDKFIYIFLIIYSILTPILALLLTALIKYKII